MAHLQVVAKGCGFYTPALAQIQDVIGALFGASIAVLSGPLGRGIVRPPCRQQVLFMSIATESEVEPIAGEARQAADPAERRRSVRPLMGLIPFVARYRTRAIAALVALTAAA